MLQIKYILYAYQWTKLDGIKVAFLGKHTADFEQEFCQTRRFIEKLMHQKSLSRLSIKTQVKMEQISKLKMQFSTKKNKINKNTAILLSK